MLYSYHTHNNNNTKREWKETFEDNGYIYSIDSGHGFMDAHLSPSSLSSIH